MSDGNKTYTPEVKAAHAFREISHDFGTPAEIFREAIANSLDAYATNIWLRVEVQKSKGKDVVVISIADDGTGMSLDTIKSFLNLSDSIKPDNPPGDMTPRRMSGYKGHGTKVYLNSRKLEVLSYDGSSDPIYCLVEDPKGKLFENEIPKANIETISSERLMQIRLEWGFGGLSSENGTMIRVHEYHDNDKIGLEHAAVKDYVIWFTRWGSWEPKLSTVAEINRPEVDSMLKCKLFLRGLGKIEPADQDELLPFGHVFPSADCTDTRELRAKDDVDPLKWFVRTWAFNDVPLKQNPDKRIDFIFALEGEAARREYNEMLRRQGRPRQPGDYLSEDRYGLWLGKDFVPVQRFNSWVAQHSEYTRMHAFVNCQDLSLTANRGSVENSEQALIADIGGTVENLFESEIKSDKDYQKFERELQEIVRYRNATREEQDYKRRLKRMESKQRAELRGVELLSPESETDLIALVSAVQALEPSILPFVVHHYDSHFGYDGLATRSKELAINETKHLFVEFKLRLIKDFNHSFKRLTAILCWESNVKDGDEVIDLAGKSGIFEISAGDHGVKKRFIVVPGAPTNVEVIIFRELLKANGVEFRPIGE